MRDSGSARALQRHDPVDIEGHMEQGNIPLPSVITSQWQPLPVPGQLHSLSTLQANSISCSSALNRSGPRAFMSLKIYDGDLFTFSHIGTYVMLY